MAYSISTSSYDVLRDLAKKMRVKKDNYDTPFNCSVCGHRFTMNVSPEMAGYEFQCPTCQEKIAKGKTVEEKEAIEKKLMGSRGPSLRFRRYESMIDPLADLPEGPPGPERVLPEMWGQEILRRETERMGQERAMAIDEAAMQYMRTGEIGELYGARFAETVGAVTEGTTPTRAEGTTLTVENIRTAVNTLREGDRPSPF